ncbi:MAG: hypothetical protein KIS66_14235 [Fimbriimonadaceae bacterium]|nr:hypothetical protein [Fimbriimonadaceae bacterium]
MVRPEEQKKVVFLLVAIVAVLAVTGFVFVSQAKARTVKNVPKMVTSASAPSATIGGPGGEAADLDRTVTGLYTKDFEFDATFRGLDPFKPRVAEHPDLVAGKVNRQVDAALTRNEAASNGGALGRPAPLEGEIVSGQPGRPIQPHNPDGVSGNVTIEPVTPKIAVQGVITGEGALAVLMVGDKAKYVHEGQVVADGVVVVKVSEAGVRLRIKGVEQMIPVGKSFAS